MNKFKLLIVFLAVALTYSCNKDNITEVKKFRILPVPEQVSINGGSFFLNKNTSITFDNKNTELKSISEYLSDYLTEYYHLSIEQSKENKNSNIKLLLTADIQDDEAYKLSIDSTSITIIGRSPAGIFYGIQSLIQIIPPQQSKVDGFLLPYCIINDKPSFKWRGMHLDVCRHFFPLEFVKKMIDMASHLKLNTFHWHLTEDQGWRIEIKKYPKLTEIGAWRKETLIGHSLEHPEKFDGKKHGGFYTQDEIKEVVEYAKQRYVNIIPEIEMPGHAMAALAAYPEYSCTGGPFEVATSWGVFDDVYCAGKESTFQFLEDILSEVIDLFPSKYIHIGGDECPKKRWKECSDCQKKIKTEKLKNEHELQSYFIKRIEKFLSSKGKKLIGWDEILEGGLAEGAAVMSWRGEDGSIEAAMSGHYVVMSPNESNYFDHYQAKYNEPLSIGGLTTLKNVYEYQPIPEALDSLYYKYILGSQANLWTEYIPTQEHAEYMLYPRLCALAEILWTKKSIQNYDEFLTRMDNLYPRLDQWDINYRVNPPEGVEDINRTIDERVEIKLFNGIPSSEIRYTLDGKAPSDESEIYNGSLTINLSEKTTLKAASFLPNGKKSEVIEAEFEKMELIDGLKTRNFNKGVAYMYYEGKFTNAEKFDNPEIYNGVVNNFRLPGDNSGKFFGVAYSGYIKIPVDGVYTFYLISSDGSILYIHDKLVVDNDNFQWPTMKSGKIALKKGIHPFRLNYFQAKYGSYFDVIMEGPGMEKQKIPDNWLWN